MRAASTLQSLPTQTIPSPPTSRASALRPHSINPLRRAVAMASFALSMVNVARSCMSASSSDNYLFDIESSENTNPKL